MGECYLKSNMNAINGDYVIEDNDKDTDYDNNDNDDNDDGSTDESTASTADTNACIEYMLFGRMNNNSNTDNNNNNKKKKKTKRNRINISLRDIQFATDEIVMDSIKCAPTSSAAPSTSTMATASISMFNTRQQQQQQQQQHQRQQTQASNHCMDHNNYTIVSQQEQQKWFQYAYRTSGTASVDSTGSTFLSSVSDNTNPSSFIPIQIVQNTDSVKGYQLMATCDIPINTVLYTEQSIFATQVLSQLLHHPTPNVSVDAATTTLSSTATTTSSPTSPANSTNIVRACQYCFQSLESISSLLDKVHSNASDINNVVTHTSITTTSDTTTSTLPLPHLYPIPELDFTTDKPQQSQSQRSFKFYRTDRLGRIQCVTCSSYFCSKHCYKQFQQFYYGTSDIVSDNDSATNTKSSNAPAACCLLQQILLPSQSSKSKSLSSPSGTTTKDNKITNQLPNISPNIGFDDDEDVPLDENAMIHNALQEQPAILLAIRMFVATIQEVRNSKRYQQQEQPIRTIIHELCGTYNDLSKLEMGIAIRCHNFDHDDDTFDTKQEVSQQYHYTVEPIYNRIVEVYSITQDEQQHDVTYTTTNSTDLSLQYFMSCIAKAARNGFGTFYATTSPFQYYYNGIIRSSIYRGSPQHKQHQSDIINALFPSQSQNKLKTEVFTDETTTNIGSSNSCEEIGGVQKWKRGMDAMIDEYVCSKIVAMYLLTSRINHSCDPNCSVHTQQYCHNHNIDVISKRPIQKGDEITISYISHRQQTNATGHSTIKRHKRQQELYSKYLFYCDCTLCSL